MRPRRIFFMRGIDIFCVLCYTQLNSIELSYYFSEVRYERIRFQS